MFDRWFFNKWHYDGLELTWQEYFILKNFRSMYKASIRNEIIRYAFLYNDVLPEVADLKEALVLMGDDSD